MDSVTQAALGASVGLAVLGRSAGRKAAVWGAVCGTLPDLDTFYPYADAVSAFTYHRSVTHSVLVLSAVTPILAWLVTRIHPKERERLRAWIALVWLALVTHPLLDACTIYGTQLLWPLSDHPVAWSNVFIIDPVFTVPLLAGIACALLWRRDRAGGGGDRGVAISRAALAFGVAYLCLGAALKVHVEAKVRASASARGIVVDRMIASPTLFNMLLWRTVVMSGSEYHESFYSLLDPPGDARFSSHTSQPELLAPIAGEWAVRRLVWFTRGYYDVRLDENEVVLSDLRMGYEPAYVFQFVLGRREPGGQAACGADSGDPFTVTPLPVRQLERPQPDRSLLAAGWRRTLGDRDALRSVVRLAEAQAKDLEDALNRGPCRAESPPPRASGHDGATVSHEFDEENHA